MTTHQRGTMSFGPVSFAAEGPCELAGGSFANYFSVLPQVPHHRLAISRNPLGARHSFDC